MMNKLRLRKVDEVVIYNFDVKKQEISFLFRGKNVPRVYHEYDNLWRVYDKQRKIETIIISI